MSWKLCQKNAEIKYAHWQYLYENVIPFAYSFADTMESLIYNINKYFTMFSDFQCY